MKEHWNKVYDSKEIDTLGWYEPISGPSIELISKCGIDKNEPILDVGVGASTLIDSLLDRGYTNIIGVDISELALNKLSERLGEERAKSVTLIADDITNPRYLQELSDIAIWHDRALLHFLLEEAHRQSYFAILKRIVKKGGFVIIAAFSLTGKKKCSGLDIINYDQNMLSALLGDDFDLIEEFDYTYITPWNEDRPYIYTLFKRKAPA